MRCCVELRDAARAIRAIGANVAAAQRDELGRADEMLRIRKRLCRFGTRLQRRRAARAVDAAEWRWCLLWSICAACSSRAQKAARVHAGDGDFDPMLENYRVSGKEVKLKCLFKDQGERV